MREDGFTRVEPTPTNVFGDRPGAIMSVLHLKVSTTTFWEVAIGAGDSFDFVKSVVDRIVEKSKRMQFA